MTNHVVVAKLAKICDAVMKPDVAASWPEANASKFKLNADGKVRHINGSKPKKFINETVRAEMPSIFLDVPEKVTAGKNNPFSAEGWSVTAQGSLAKALITKHGEEEGKKRLAQISSAAGCSYVGATKPGATKRLTQAYEKGADGRPTRVA